MDLNQFIALIAEPQKTQLLSASDWEMLLWILDTARLEAWLFAQIKQQSMSCKLPATVASRLISATIYAERQQQQVRFECQTTASLLAEKQIEPLFLKGAAYVISSQFYSAGRVCSDIDALVQHNDLETSERHLKMNMWLSQEVDDYDDKYYREYAHEIPPMMQSERGTVLDLHHNLFLPVSGRAPNISQFWALRTRNENGLSTLKPAAALVHSMIHLLMNEEVTYGLRDCLDMQSIIDTHNSESFWLEVSTLVVDNDFTHEYQLLLLLLDSLFGRETVQQQILAQQITADTKTRFWLWCYRKAVMPDHPQLCNPYAGVARAAVYCRGHSQKMPLATLLKHSTVKLYKAARKALVGEADKEQRLALTGHEHQRPLSVYTAIGTRQKGHSMISESQLHQLAELCRQASDIEIMPRFRQLEDTHIEQKLNHNDLVTIADQAAEKFIMERLHTLYPDALLIGEESVYADATALDQYQDAELSFVLDPIDGTWHYANGSVYFGVMLGVASYGKMIGGIIFEPVTGHYLWALEGKGAFDRINGTDHPLRVGRHASRKLSDTMGCYSFGVAKGGEREQALQVASKLGRLMDYRCAAAEYRLLVTGAISFVVFQNTLNLWDHGAGQLIAKEAGAATRMLNGEDYQPQVAGKLIVAESEARWQELATLFNSN